MNKYRITRFILYPIIFIADFLQNNFTKYFTLMNVGPVSTKNWSDLISKYFTKKDYILDFGCGVGFFSKHFHHKKYIGIDVNKEFILNAKKNNKKYKFLTFEDKNILKYKNIINSIYISNVLHHLSDDDTKKIFNYFRNHTKKKSKILII